MPAQEGAEGKERGDGPGNGPGVDGSPEIYAIVRIRGPANMNKGIRHALRRLMLKKVHACTIARSSPTIRGMLLHAEDYITWGPIEEPVLVKMLEKRGRSKSGARIDAKHAKALASKIIKEGMLGSADVRPVFGLASPSGGLRSVRLQYPRGDLGFRGEKMNELLLRMI
ncbi:MAG: uL30 family ribosomal protein [Candidatus Aenigmarchaeota archaeon]|nr:uL30 family ribosomal protein [Candidatus Aenigmarchaeota archaeon]